MSVLGWAQYYLSYKERFRLIDRQIDEMAAIIYASDLSKTKIENVEVANHIVSDALGRERVLALISLYDEKRNLLYQNNNAEQLQLVAPALPRRQTLELQGHVVRLLNFPLAKEGKLLQVGLILDSVMDRWRNMSLHLILYAFLTLCAISAISFVLSKMLLRPIENLAMYLHHRVSHFDDQPSSVTNPFPSPLSTGKDEIGKLTRAVQAFHEKFQNAAKVSRSRAAQLAHEFKTPLTLIRYSLEELLKTSDPRQSALVKESLSEVDRLSGIVNSFTQLSLFEASPTLNLELHAIRLDSLAEAVVQRLQRVYPNRIHFEKPGKSTVFADPAHAEQAITNLLMNSLIHTAPDSPVQISVEETTLLVRDQGPGVPNEVLERLGAPFNLGKSTKKGSNSGLGLAWVHIIAKKYGWIFNLRNTPTGVEASLEMTAPA